MSSGQLWLAAQWCGLGMSLDAELPCEWSPRRHVPYGSALCQELSAPLLPCMLLHILAPAMTQV